jgi:hypothetical protein
MYGRGWEIPVSVSGDDETGWLMLRAIDEGEYAYKYIDLADL